MQRNPTILLQYVPSVFVHNPISAHINIGDLIFFSCLEKQYPGMSDLFLHILIQLSAYNYKSLGKFTFQFTCLEKQYPGMSDLFLHIIIQLSAYNYKSLRKFYFPGKKLKNFQEKQSPGMSDIFVQLSALNFTCLEKQSPGMSDLFVHIIQLSAYNYSELIFDLSIPHNVVEPQNHA